MHGNRYACPRSGFGRNRLMVPVNLSAPTRVRAVFQITTTGTPAFYYKLRADNTCDYTAQVRHILQRRRSYSHSRPAGTMIKSTRSGHSQMINHLKSSSLWPWEKFRQAFTPSSPTLCQSAYAYVSPYTNVFSRHR